MGLDMYLNGNKYLPSNWKNPETDRTEDGIKIKNIIVELGYWRKHPDLHGFIVEMFADGKDECQEIELDVDQMRMIIEAIRENRLPHTTGFFFGSSENDEEQKNEAIASFERAIAWLEDGKGKDATEWRSVSYRASW
jgi:hypothetical protein